MLLQTPAPPKYISIAWMCEYRLHDFLSFFREKGFPPSWVPLTYNQSSKTIQDQVLQQQSTKANYQNPRRGKNQITDLRLPSYPKEFPY
jgi:hypothetical protein